MPSRQPHRKTRTGCKKCKERKVKCDQRRPICNACERLGHHCSFSHVPSIEGSVHLRTGTGSPEKGGPEGTPLASDLHIQDLELFHHYATSTCFTSTDRPSLYHVWQVTVPKLALRHPFLLRGLLAMAALHLHHGSTSEKDKAAYLRLASLHHDFALSGYREELGRISGHNSQALFAFSSQIAGISLAFLQHTAPTLYGHDYIAKVLAIFDLLIGAKTVGIEAKPWVKAEDLLPLTLPLETDSPSNSQISSQASASLNALLLLVENNAGLADDAPGLMASTSEGAAAYAQSIEGIRQIFLYTRNDRPDISTALAWPVLTNSPLFMHLLKQNDSMALIILAHYGAALHCFTDIWWAEGLGAQLVNAVVQVIEPAWLVYLQWPIAFTEVPPEQSEETF